MTQDAVRLSCELEEPMELVGLQAFWPADRASG
jgi:hypothetical protein